MSSCKHLPVIMESTRSNLSSAPSLYRLHRDDQPDFILKLTSDDLGFRDEANAPAHELQRRDELARLKYYARIVMNGQVVSETAVRSIEWPRFALPFHKSVHLWLLRRPQSLAIELWRKRYAHVQ